MVKNIYLNKNKKQRNEKTETTFLYIYILVTYAYQNNLNSEIIKSGYVFLLICIVSLVFVLKNAFYPLSNEL